MCTEAVRTQSRELVLGRSLSEFMRTLDIYSNSGRVHTRLRNQMKRLFGCTVTMVYEEPGGFARVSSFVADKHEWWNERKPNESSLWESKIYLGEQFFNEIIRHPVPLDMNTLTALKRSPLGLDLYLWLTLPHLRPPLRLTWRLLYSQFGAHPAKASDNNTVQAFRYKVLRELKEDYAGKRHRLRLRGLLLCLKPPPPHVFALIGTFRFTGLVSFRPLNRIIEYPPERLMEHNR